MICNQCKDKIKRKQKARNKAIKWLVKHPELWKNKNFFRLGGRGVSLWWSVVCCALKYKRIYQKNTYNWDINIEELIKEVKRRVNENRRQSKGKN